MRDERRELESEIEEKNAPKLLFKWLSKFEPTAAVCADFWDAISEAAGRLQCHRKHLREVEVRL